MVLAAGAIAFTGFDQTTQLNFNFVALTDLAAGTAINFTDNNWDGTQLGTGESTWTWTADTAVAAGTVVTLEDLLPQIYGGTVAATSNHGSIAYSGTQYGQFSAETLYAYTGDAATPNFISAISNWPYYSNQSLLDGTGLATGVSAINLSPITYDPYIGAYHGPSSGFTSFADYQAALNDVGKWAAQRYTSADIGSDGIAPDLPLSTASFTVDPSVETIGFALDSINVSAAEGNPGDHNLLTFTVTRNGSTAGAIDFSGGIVLYHAPVVEGIDPPPDINVDGADFGGAFPSFHGTIADGASSAVVTVAISGDIVSEPDEIFDILLNQVSNPGNPTVIGGSNVSHATILNDDPAQVVSFGAADHGLQVVEGNSGTQTVNLTVERTGGTVGALDFTVNVSSLGGTVTADDFGGTLPGSPYTGGNLPEDIHGTIAAGQTSATITVTIAGDTRYETDDHVFFQLTAASNAEVGAVLAENRLDQTADLTILNDDPAPTSLNPGQTAEGTISLTGQQHFVVAAGAHLAHGDSDGILANVDTVSNVPSAIVIDNFGRFEGGGNGLDASGSAGTVVFNNAIGATVAGEFELAGIQVGAVATVNNAGSIGTGAFRAFDLPRSGGLTIINNLPTGLITDTAPGSDVIKNGSFAVINNQGRIVSPADYYDSDNVLQYSGDAIDVSSGTHDIIHNMAGGLIEGSHHAVTGKRDITVINDAGATLLGRNGSGVNMDNNGDPANAAHVTNHGTIIGASQNYDDSDGDAIDADGLLYLDNYGLIEGVGNNGYHNGSPNVSQGLAIGGGIINNFAGGTIYGYGNAIQADNSDNGPALGATTIYNEGLIQGDGNGPTGVLPADAASVAFIGKEAINIIDSFADTVTNKGTIIGGVELGGGDDRFVAYAGSTVSGPIDGGDGSDTLVLTGTGFGMLGSFTSFETVAFKGGDWTLNSENVGTTVVFGAYGLELRLGQSTLFDGHFASTISGLQAGDALDLKGIGLATAAKIGAGNVLSVTGGTTSVTLQLDPAQTLGGHFNVASDSAGGTLLSYVDGPALTPSGHRPLNILLTNDDGYNAPGIMSLYNALVADGNIVHIVAPQVNQSAQGSTLGGIAGITSPIAYTEFSDGNYYVSGSPDVTAKTALEFIAPDLLHFTPDVVISGTNAGDNTGESENISGTVNAAVTGLLDGLPAIAVSAGRDASGSYTAAFSNAGQIVVDLLHRLESTQAAGEPLLPTGQGLSINVPGASLVKGEVVTTIDAESSAQYPIGLKSNGLYNSAFIPDTTPSGNPLSEGSQYLSGNATISPIDGNWTSTEADRAALESRLGTSLGQATPTSGHPLHIMLTNDDGYSAAGINAVRDALLAAGDIVTIVAPATDQSGRGTALTLSDFTVTTYDAGYQVGATPATTVETGLDALLTGSNRPDLVVSGTNAGANVGLPAVSSGTIGAAITALFNYDIPSIAISTATTSGDQAGLYATSANFLVKLIADLQATAGADGHLLPDHVGLNVNVPVAANPALYAFTTLDAATNLTLTVGAGSTDGQAAFQFGGPVNTGDPHSEGTHFNMGEITITPLDGNFASRDVDFTNALADALNAAPGTAAPGIDYVGASRAGFSVTLDAGGAVHLTPLGGAETVLTGIEKLTFTEGTLDVHAATDAGLAIVELYQGVLGRAPDAGGFTAWLGANAQGMSLTSIAQAFVGSQEAAATNAGMSDAGFTTELYERFLDRAPDSAGLTSWTNALAHGLDRGTEALMFAGSQEYQTGHLGSAFAHVVPLNDIWI